MDNIEKEMRYRLYGIDQVIDFISVFSILQKLI